MNRTDILNTISTLTAKGRDAMEDIGRGRVSFFDNGMVAGSGSWGECLVPDLGHKSSGVINRLVTMGLFTSYLADGNSRWYELTELGAAVARELHRQYDEEAAHAENRAADEIIAYEIVREARQAAFEAAKGTSEYVTSPDGNTRVTVVTMPSGEVRYFARQYNGYGNGGATSRRFGCAWDETHAVVFPDGLPPRGTAPVAPASPAPVIHPDGTQVERFQVSNTRQTLVRTFSTGEVRFTTIEHVAGQPWSNWDISHDVRIAPPVDPAEAAEQAASSTPVANMNHLIPLATRNYRMDHAAAEGRPVTEGHARFCQENGHATHLSNGADIGLCPRCGDETAEVRPPALKRPTTAPAAPASPVPWANVVEAVFGALTAALDVVSYSSLFDAQTSVVHWWVRSEEISVGHTGPYGRVMIRFSQDGRTITEYAPLGKPLDSDPADLATVLGDLADRVKVARRAVVVNRLAGLAGLNRARVDDLLSRVDQNRSHGWTDRDSADWRAIQDAALAERAGREAATDSPKCECGNMFRMCHPEA